jgi:CubicO group peptidase (beta-lactamase class C family)
MMRRRVKAAGVLVLVAIAVPLALVARQPAAPPFDGLDDAAPPFDGFDAFVMAVMREWKVPGLAVAAVRDGAVVLSRRDTDTGMSRRPCLSRRRR